MTLWWAQATPLAGPVAPCGLGVVTRLCNSAAFEAGRNDRGERVAWQPHMLMHTIMVPFMHPLH